MSVDRSEITDSLIELLRTGTRKSVGDAEIPGGGGFPYHVVHPIPGGGTWGAPLVDPDANADFVYQVDSVSKRRKEAEVAADTARRTILHRTSSGTFQVAMKDPTGWKIADRQYSGTPGGLIVTGNPPNRIFTISERFTFRVVAA